MILGEKIKIALKTFNTSEEEAAVAADMSVGNIFKIYKKDSTETRYLVSICNLLGVDMNYFFEDQLTALKLKNTGQSNFAQRVGKNHQSINVGGMSKEECEDKLLDLQEKYDLARKSLADKELIIEMLQGKKKKKE